MIQRFDFLRNTRVFHKKTLRSTKNSVSKLLTLFYLDKGIKITASVEEGNQQGDHSQKQTNYHGCNVHSGKLSAGIPCSLIALAKAT